MLGGSDTMLGGAVNILGSAFSDTLHISLAAMDMVCLPTSYLTQPNSADQLVSFMFDIFITKGTAKYK